MVGPVRARRSAGAGADDQNAVALGFDFMRGAWRAAAPLPPLRIRHIRLDYLVTVGCLFSTSTVLPSLVRTHILLQTGIQFLRRSSGP